MPQFFTQIFCEGSYGAGSSSQNCVATTTATSSPAFLNGFSFDGIIVSFFLFIIWSVLAFQFVFFWVRGFRIRQK
jgi:hypothetical protein